MVSENRRGLRFRVERCDYGRFLRLSMYDPADGQVLHQDIHQRDFLEAMDPSGVINEAIEMLMRRKFREHTDRIATAQREVQRLQHQLAHHDPSFRARLIRRPTGEFEPATAAYMFTAPECFGPSPVEDFRDQYCVLGTSTYFDISTNPIYPRTVLNHPKALRQQVAQAEKQRRKAFRAEARAQVMLREIVGFEQWQVYRRTCRVAIFGKWNWLIGDVFGQYNRAYPMRSKPDVVRVDGRSKLSRRYQTTYFCVEDRAGENIPYTDKVLAFAVHCLNDESGFYKLANRLGERSFNKVPECALFEEGDRSGDL